MDKKIRFIYITCLIEINKNSILFLIAAKKTANILQIKYNVLSTFQLLVEAAYYY